MAHLIMEADLGYVYGTTWHGLDNYKQLSVPVNADQCLEVLNYPMEKRPNFVYLNGQLVQHEGSFSIVRTDSEKVLVESVGKDFVIINNDVFFRSINDSLIVPNSDKIHVESVGTLMNGQIAFVNIALKDIHINGDQSETKTKIAYYNPLGQGSYKAFCHSIRIVCNNTLRMAEAQGAANQTIHKISHTKSAADRIENAVTSLAELYLGIEQHKTLLNAMSAMQVTLPEFDSFAKALYGWNGKEGKGQTRFENNKEELQNIFETQDGFDVPVATSRYALLQAVTNLVDHEDLRKGNDAAYRSWDGLVGNNAKFKEKALVLLNPKNDLMQLTA